MVTESTYRCGAVLVGPVNSFKETGSIFALIDGGRSAVCNRLCRQVNSRGYEDKTASVYRTQDTFLNSVSLDPLP